jgi:adenylate cyclase
MSDPAVARILTGALGAAASTRGLQPVLLGLRDALRQVGVGADRMQLPLLRELGFRHPELALLLLTWSDDQGPDESIVLRHDELDGGPLRGAEGTPYERVIDSEDAVYVRDLHAGDDGYPVLGELRERGYRHYAAVALPMPSGFDQPLSLASRSPFPADVETRLLGLRDVFALAVYGAYRTSQAMRVSSTYIGAHAGPRVLAGDIVRGHTERLHAGIMFCDIRGFTALSQHVEPEVVVAMVNRVFAVVGAEAEARGGEILKFIGDAMLLVFPVHQGPGPVAQAMVGTARAAAAGVASLDGGLRVGFGGHIGEVVQGNIGTPARLDFTVMGAAVNLASRLEGLCSPLGVTAVFSGAVARHAEGLAPAGHHALKGVDAPVLAHVPS